MSAKSILDAFGTKLKEDLQKSIDAEIKKNASKHGSDYGGNSRLAASVRFYYASTSNSTFFKLAMNDYWINFNDGRGKNKKAPPTKPIEAWVRKRGLKKKEDTDNLSFRQIGNRQRKTSDFKLKLKSTKDKADKKKLKNIPRDKEVKGIAFVIARSIGRKGIEPTHFFDKIIKDGRMTKLKQDLGKDLIGDILNGN